MKIIDLLNKIANGEEIPKKIKFDDRLYTFDKKKDNYYENETCSINWDYVSLHCLNEKVEIIEEDKKIEKIIPTSLSGIENLDEKIEVAHIDTVNAMDKINEIIDEIKKLKEGK